jgi:hypothetical protein
LLTATRVGWERAASAAVAAASLATGAAKAARKAAGAGRSGEEAAAANGNSPRKAVASRSGITAAGAAAAVVHQLPGVAEERPGRPAHQQAAWGCPSGLAAAATLSDLQLRFWDSPEQRSKDDKLCKKKSQKFYAQPTCEYFPQESSSNTHFLCLRNLALSDL